MRLDLFLKTSRLIKRRSVAKRLCDQGHLMLNGRPAKASSSVQNEDEIQIETDHQFRRVKVLSVPRGAVRKSEASGLYELLEEKRLDPTRAILDALDIQVESSVQEGQSSSGTPGGAESP